MAYAFIPHFAGEEYFDGLKYPKEWYKVSVENTFPARRYAAEIFNRQGRDCDLKSMTNRILRQPGNKVRASYSLEGMDMAQKAAKILEATGCIENMEGYCVLRYGAKKEKRHDRIFYGVRAPPLVLS